MKSVALLAVLATAATTVAVAQAPAPAKAPEIPPAKCEPKPEFPGRLASDTRRKLFDREMKAYKDCMQVYLDERKAAIKANEVAANAAIEEHNAVMKKIQEEQAAARQ